MAKKNKVEIPCSSGMSFPVVVSPTRDEPEFVTFQTRNNFNRLDPNVPESVLQDLFVGAFVDQIKKSVDIKCVCPAGLDMGKCSGVNWSYAHGPKNGLRDFHSLEAAEITGEDRRVVLTFLAELLMGMGTISSSQGPTMSGNLPPRGPTNPGGGHGSGSNSTIRAINMNPLPHEMTRATVVKYQAAVGTHHITLNCLPGCWKRGDKVPETTGGGWLEILTGQIVYFQKEAGKFAESERIRAIETKKKLKKTAKGKGGERRPFDLAGAGDGAPPGENKDGMDRFMEIFNNLFNR